MSLADRLKTPPAPHARKTRIEAWVETLADEDRTAVLAAAKDPAWNHMDLLRTLMAEGMPNVADVTLAAWRRKQGYGTR